MLASLRIAAWLAMAASRALTPSEGNYLDVRAMTVMAGPWFR
jgi:hypothetical protein